MKNLKEFGFNTDNRTYIIAEIGINHGGDIELAKKLIDSAVRSGVDAVKFQTYLTEKRAPEGNQVVFDILKKHELPLEAFGELKKYADQYDVEFFSTAFDKESIDYLESIDCSIYKVASFDVVNHQLLKDVSLTGKPAIMSVGMANFDEISEAYKILKRNSDKIALLHCISSYPTKPEDANLAAMLKLQKEFDCIIGQSDHTNDIQVPLYAAAAGAQILEKHFKIDDEMDCIDAPVSITEKQMRELVSEVRKIEKIFGTGALGIRQAEKAIVPFRRPS
ncbi:MAG: N-acetylneuraminate synthase family protein [Lentisphaeraceae bacterium]|nr:N-acetylneuraminate synthase family protein [Lentisphaeraceae bacterium]